MGMSTCIEGYTPTNETWRKMKKVYDACVEAEIKIPEEVQQFFNYKEPNSLGVQINLNDHDAIIGYKEMNSEGYEINLSKLPKSIKFLRFYNSW